MTKNQKMLLGVGAVAVVGYLIYQNNKPKGFANAVGRPTIMGGISNSTTAKPRTTKCEKYTGETGYYMMPNANGIMTLTTVYECAGQTGQGGIYTTVPPTMIRQDFAGDRKANLFGRRKKKRRQAQSSPAYDPFTTLASQYPDYPVMSSIGY